MFEFDFHVPSVVNYCDLDPCENGATCTVEVDDYSCACMAGYEGKNCSQGMIHNFPSSSHYYESKGRKKFTALKIYLYLWDNNDCNSDPCENGATCADEVNDYKFSCMAVYDGKNCSQSKLDHLSSYSTCK